MREQTATTKISWRIQAFRSSRYRLVCHSFEPRQPFIARELSVSVVTSSPLLQTTLLNVEVSSLQYERKQQLSPYQQMRA